MDKNKRNYGERLFEVYHNSLQGLDEVIEKLWTIIDSSKTDEKEKMKAINSIMQYYMMRFEMIKSEPEQFSFNDENCGINIHTPSCCRDRINDLSFTTNKITNNISETIYIEKQKVLLNSTSEPKNQRFALSV